MDEELDLSQALAYLLGARTAVGDFGQAQELAGRSIQLASRWPDSWISKALRVHAHAWFFFDPAAALDVFGGPEEADRLLGPQSTSLVSHFTKAVGSLCGKRYDQVLMSLRASAELEPGNPFIDCLEAIVLVETNSREVTAAVNRFLTEHVDHPLCALFDEGSPYGRA